MTFTKYINLFEKERSPIAGITTCHYPCAWEHNGKRYIIATIGYENKTDSKRGAGLIAIDLKCLDNE